MASSPQPNNSDSQEYDYVIICGGIAGLALAARLSEDSSIQIAVLEAGEKRLNVSTSPSQ
jgi:choline dehydrogenase